MKAELKSLIGIFNSLQEIGLELKKLSKKKN